MKTLKEFEKRADFLLNSQSEKNLKSIDYSQVKEELIEEYGRIGYMRRFHDEMQKYADIIEHSCEVMSEEYCANEGICWCLEVNHKMYDMYDVAAVLTKWLQRKVVSFLVYNELDKNILCALKEETLNDMAESVEYDIKNASYEDAIEYAIKTFA